MSVGTIGQTGYRMAEYQAGKSGKNVESGAVKFMDTEQEKEVQNKEVQDKADEYHEKAFNMVGPNAP